MGKFDSEILAYGLKNAIEYGFCDSGKILPKLFQHGLKKEEIKEVMPDIQSIVTRINSMDAKQMNELYKDFSKFVKEKEEKERDLPELAEVSDKMVFRMAPFPSGGLHIGNAKTYMLNALYAEKYKAKLLLIMDDTIGSEEKQLVEESYGLIEDAWRWLKVEYNKPIIYKSDRIKTYYKYAEKLIDIGKAYVCYCPQETLRENRAKGMECSCRQFPSNIQMKRWEEMFKAKVGEATLRIKTDMQHPNPAFRDRVLFRLSDRKHPRVGNDYRVWPTLEMTWAIDDHLLGITHILRGNDLMIETDMERYIWDIFGWKHPVCLHAGLVRIEGIGAKVSKSKAQKEVKSGEFIGWDDPRTWSMQSLQRRGILPEAVREFIKEIGFNKQDITIPIDSLYSVNRKMIDLIANRYYFVKNPVKIEIENKPDVEVVDVPYHPEKKELRHIKVDEVYIANEDLELNNGKEVRLIHLFNVELGSKSKFTTMDNKSIPKIQWVSEHVPAKILMVDGTTVEGYAEVAVKKLNIGDILQFERFGFVRFDGVNKVDGKDVYNFWFAHK
jgi:glutamyl-tRNA synthetase